MKEYPYKNGTKITFNGKTGEVVNVPWVKKEWIHVYWDDGWVSSIRAADYEYEKANKQS
jgi:hypothetical protein